MKKTLLLLSLASTLMAADPTPAKPAKKPWLKDQTDQSDTFAIPLDSSEEEENQEMEALKKDEKLTKPSH